MLIDFHCHSYSALNTECLEIVSCHPDRKDADQLHTIGYHPWWSLENLTEKHIHFLKHHFLSNPQCIAIGECGLDKYKGASMQIQTTNLISQIELANELNAPVIIHCVRKYPELIDIHKQYAKTPWAIHGFARNKTLATTLLDTGIFLSIAPYEKMNKAYEDMLAFLPFDRIFLETDSDRRTTIASRYAIFASLRGLDIGILKEKIVENSIKFFGSRFESNIQTLPIA